MPHLRRVAIITTVLVLAVAVLLSSFYISQRTQPAPAPVSASDLAALTYYTEQYPPYNYQENGTLKGVSVDLLGAITEKMGDQSNTRTGAFGSLDRRLPSNPNPEQHSTIFHGTIA